MKFYLFNGTSAEGPFGADELLKQPGFSSESLIAPAGSSAVDDWKPAITFDILKSKLLESEPTPTLAPPPGSAPGSKSDPESNPVPAPEPPDPKKPCSKCSTPNPEAADFCYSCGKPFKEGAAPPGEAPGPWTLPKGKKALIAVGISVVVSLALGLAIPFPRKDSSSKKKTSAPKEPKLAMKPKTLKKATPEPNLAMVKKKRRPPRRKRAGTRSAAKRKKVAPRRRRAKRNRRPRNPRRLSICRASPNHSSPSAAAGIWRTNRRPPLRNSGSRARSTSSNSAIPS